MARRLPGGAGRASRVGRASHGARRAWPLVMMAWERWQSLSEADKERYRRQAREYAERGRHALDKARSGRPGAGGRRRY